MLNKSFVCLLILSIAVHQKGFSQQNATSTLINADSLSSGNYKDIFINFFQLAANDLTGPNKSVLFNANPYAIMLKHDSNLAKYPAYRRLTYLRNLNFSVGAQLDSAYHFNGMTIGLKYALVNNRDFTVKKQFLAQIRNDRTFQLDSALAVNFTTEIGALPADQEVKMNDNLRKFLKDSTTKLKDFDSTFKFLLRRALKKIPNRTYRKMVLDDNFNFYRNSQLPFDSLKKLYQNKALWTLGISDTSYNDGLFFKNLQFTTEYLKGILTPGHLCNIELDLKSSANFTDDTLTEGRNIGREIWVVEPGFNITLSGGQTHQSYFELKFSGSYNNILEGQYSDEKKIFYTANASLRFRVLNKIWIPLTIKYDLTNHNVLGFLNVSLDFNSLGKN
jgi:hypothetical protein